MTALLNRFCTGAVNVRINVFREVHATQTAVIKFGIALSQHINHTTFTGFWHNYVLLLLLDPIKYVKVVRVRSFQPEVDSG